MAEREKEREAASRKPFGGRFRAWRWRLDHELGVWQRLVGEKGVCFFFSDASGGWLGTRDFDAGQGSPLFAGSPANRMIW